MANSKFRCLFCKDYFPRDQMISTPKGNFCTIDHATKYGIASIPKTRKMLEKRNRMQKRAYKADSLPHQIELTQPIFNRLVVLLDKNEPCGSCGEWKCGWIWDCGHVKSRGSHPELRFDFLNAYKQGRKCNGGQRRLSSHEKTVSKMYEERLIKTKGQALVDYLNGPHKAKHYTREGLKEMRAMYAAEIRHIEKNGSPSRDWRKLENA